MSELRIHASYGSRPSRLGFAYEYYYTHKNVRV